MFQIFILLLLILYFSSIIYLLCNIKFTYENKVNFDDCAKIMYFSIDDSVDELLYNKIENENIKEE